MPNALSVTDINAARLYEREKLLRYGLGLSGAYVQAGARGTNVGEVINLGVITGSFQPEQFWGYRGPVRGYVLQGPGGFTICIRPGADAFHWVLQIFSSTTGAELAAGAYPAAITGDLDMILEFSGRAFD